jgi:type III secretion protein Q
VPVLPIPLPTVTAGFAALARGAREAGRAAAARASAALAAELGVPVEIAGRPLASPAAPALGAVRLGLSLGDPAAPGAIEVEAGLAARLVDLMAGGSGEAPAAASALAPIELSALELLVLFALSGAADGHAPRLTREARDCPEALAVELAVSAGRARGWCRLLLPGAAVRAACEGAAGEFDPLVDGWLASGSSIVAPSDLEALAPGDVLVLDESPSPRVELHLPGLRLAGREEGGAFHLEEIMPGPAEASLLVTVEIARIQLPLGDLARLEPGAALPLHAPRDGRVALRLGERRMATGQLVEIEGALGVRIDRLEGSP